MVVFTDGNRVETNLWIDKLQCDRDLHKNVKHISIQHKYRSGIADSVRFVHQRCSFCFRGRFRYSLSRPHCGALPTYWAVRAGGLFPQLERPIATVTSDAYLMPMFMDILHSV